ATHDCREDRQNHERHGHDAGRFVGMMPRLVRNSLFPEEGQEERSERVERGQPGREYADPIETAIDGMDKSMAFMRLFTHSIQNRVLAPETEKRKKAGHPQQAN